MLSMLKLLGIRLYPFPIATRAISHSTSRIVKRNMGGAYFAGDGGRGCHGARKTGHSWAR